MSAPAKVTGRRVRETEAAILIKQGDFQMWVPLSQISHISRKAGSQEEEFTMPAWLAKEKGFDFED